MIDGVIRAVDMFDLVLPTRIARNGTCMTSQGRLVVKMLSLLRTFTPLDPEWIATCKKLRAPLPSSPPARLMKPLVSA